MIWRIRDRSTFAAFATAPRRRAGPVTVTFLAGPTAEPPRVAYAVGRRAGPAVTRNRIRRRLREVVRTHAELLEPGGAYLVGAAASAATAPFDELDAALTRCLTDLRASHGSHG